jgi:acetylornithine deacetylase/succinyl-diaminopimelate desuccinylase-like protein
MTTFATDQATIYKQPYLLLQNLIRFDTTNPPGNESECVKYLESLLTAVGIQTSIFALDPGRPNLIARLKGQGNAPPLLLFGHVDVVTAENQSWRHPPFEGTLADGYIWGRGALDMKGGVAMMVAAFLRTKIEGSPPPGDVVLAIVSDEERGSNFGAKYLIENHASLFNGVRYAVGEFGGFTFYIGKKRFYPIMVAEKGYCLLEASIRGKGGYFSLGIHDSTMSKLGWILHELDRHRTPLHVTNVAKWTIKTISDNLPFPSSLVLRQLLNPTLSATVMKLLAAKGEVFEPMLHNTINATVIRGVDNISVIPENIILNLPCFLVPGFSTVERFYISVVYRPSRPTEIKSNFVIVCPFVKILRNEFRTVINPDKTWSAMRRFYPVHDCDHVLSSDMLSYLDGQAFPTKVIDYS